MSVGGDLIASALARPVDLGAWWNATDHQVRDRFDPIYGPALARLPRGPQVFRGLPFQLAEGGDGPAWLLLTEPITIDLADRAPASHLVIAHFADSWRGDDGRRPAGSPVGWVIPTGEPLARYALTDVDGTTTTVDIRRRFEVNDGIIGWGYLPFAAIGHRSDEVVDWRGPHPRQAPGRYAASGHAGPLTILPGGWGPAQTGVADHVPTPTDDATYWLHAIPLGVGRRLATVRLVPLADSRPGSDVVIAGLTLFDGSAHPLVVRPRRQLLVTGFGTGLPIVDLGITIRSVMLPVPRPTAPPDQAPSAAASAVQVEAGAAPWGWGTPSTTGWIAAGDSAAAPASDDRAGSRAVLDIAVAPDARLAFGDWTIGAEALDRRQVSPSGTISVEPLPTPDIRLEVTVSAGPDPGATPARVRFMAADGRYLPPLGHRDEVNPGLFEDAGTDIILGQDVYAYVPGAFAIDLPRGAVSVEIVKGFEYAPLRMNLTVGPESRRLALHLERPIDLRPAGWMTADAHVHFLAPSTALVQAAAEGIDQVHVLATQWGDQHTSINDLEWGSMLGPDGRQAVVLGTENRQNVLGHVGLLGARRPVLPLSTGGAPEGRIGSPLTELIADWADRCHASGGLVVAAHFPLPYAEIATDIVTGRIDAIELQCFAPGLDNPSILEWYRFLNCGFRLPVTGGTDKMSAEVPVGAVRTYARIDPGVPPTFDAWAAAVRAGRTFATSGPVIELEVDGHAIGDIVELPPSGGRLEVRARVRAAQSVIRALEIVVNGEVVATSEPATATDDLTLSVPIDVRSGSWIAARSRSNHEIHSAFATSMAAHTSPIYVEVPDRPLVSPRDASAIGHIIDGTLAWVRDLAVIERPADRDRMVALIAASAATLRDGTAIGIATTAAAIAAAQERTT